jgi:hypothetical protein
MMLHISPFPSPIHYTDFFRDSHASSAKISKPKKNQPIKQKSLGKKIPPRPFYQKNL